MSDINSVTISVERFKILEAIEKNYNDKIVEVKQEFDSALQKDFIEINTYWPAYRQYISTVLSKDEVYNIQKARIEALERPRTEATPQSKAWYRFWK